MMDQRELQETLRRQADRVGPATLELEDVKGRARGIHRRRLVVPGLAAAAIVLGAVPVGIALGHRNDDAGVGIASGRGTPATQAASIPPEPHMTPNTKFTPKPLPLETPTLTPVPPTAATTVLLTSNIEQGSGEPQIPYLFNGTITRPDGSVVPVAAYDSVAPLGNGWVVTGDSGGGSRFTALLDAKGHETAKYPGSGVLAVSPDGTLVSFAAGSQLHVVWDGGSTTLPTPSGSHDLTPVAIQGSGRCDGAGGGDCLVYFDATGASGPAAYASSSQVPDAVAGKVAGFVRVIDVSTTGLQAGQTTLGDGSMSTACWAVRRSGGTPFGLGGTPLWSTCDYQLGRFSPDGRFVLGYPAEGDGRGPTSVTVLDATTGTPLVTYRPPHSGEVFVHQAVWDADGTILATLWDTDHWALMRMTTDGQLSSVSKGGLANGLDPDVVPLYFAARP